LVNQRTRLSVEFILGLLAGGCSAKDVLDEYLLTPEQLRAVFAYAHDLAGEEVIYALPSTS
jgi:uncharacterized protein (DUF433 family)